MAQTFKPEDHLMQIGRGEKAKDYLEVKWRLVWFREQCPQGTIDTEEMAVDLDRDVQDEVSVWNNEKRKMEKVINKGKGYARYRAVVTDGKGGRATATKSENAASFPDFIEKAETGAIGRALAMLGYGTQFTGMELQENHRIVDSPVERSEPQQTTQSQQHTQAPRQIQPVATGQSKPVLDMIATAKRRVESMQLIWDDVKRDAFGSNIPDASLTVELVAKINGYCTTIQRNQQKAS